MRTNRFRPSFDSLCSRVVPSDLTAIATILSPPDPIPGPTTIILPGDPLGTPVPLPDMGGVNCTTG